MSETVPTSKGFHSSSCQCGLCVPNVRLMELPSSTLEAIEAKHGQAEALRIAKLPALEQHAELNRLIELENTLKQNGDLRDGAIEVEL